MLSPQETHLDCISVMLRNIKNLTVLLDKWWMNETNAAYSSQITTSTMIDPRHG